MIINTPPRQRTHHLHLNRVKHMMWFHVSTTTTTHLSMSCLFCHRFSRFSHNLNNNDIIIIFQETVKVQTMTLQLQLQLPVEIALNGFRSILLILIPFTFTPSFSAYQSHAVFMTLFWTHCSLISRFTWGLASLQHFTAISSQNYVIFFIFIIISKKWEEEKR